MVSSSSQAFSQHAADLRDHVNRALESYSRFEDGCPAALQDAINYSLLAPGKRLRPILVLLAAEACGSTRGAAMPVACGIEMVHAYSLIHDDLPAMDDDDLRRGRPTCHKVFGEAVAILAGDALLTRAFHLIAEHVKPERAAVRCCTALAAAAGADGMVGGQADDLAWEAKTGIGSDEDCRSMLESIHRRKTGALLQAALVLGGLVAEADRDKMLALETYGRHLGLAFQITDDLLDAAGEEAATGKRVQKDAGRGKLTYPEILGIDESRHLAAQMVATACNALEPLGAGAEDLDLLAKFVLERDR